MQTVTLTTREYAAELALVGAREVEAADVSTCIHISATQTQGLVALGNHLVNSLLRVDVLVLLVNISQLHGLTHLECTAICLLQAHNEAEEGSLAGSQEAGVNVNFRHNNLTFPNASGDTAQGGTALIFN